MTVVVGDVLAQPAPERLDRHLEERGDQIAALQNNTDVVEFMEYMLSTEAAEVWAGEGMIPGSERPEFVRVAVMLVHSDCVLGPRHRRSLN